MEMGTLLAALDNNKNCGRKQKQTITPRERGIGLKIKRHYRVAYRKPSKKHIARKFYDAKTYYYMQDIMQRVREKAASGQKRLSPTKRKTMAPPPTERLSRSELIGNCIKYARF